LHESQTFLVPFSLDFRPSAGVIVAKILFLSTNTAAK
jgi:hypothetical protein